jgi:hypothetical protein
MMGERRVMQEALFYGFSLERHVPDGHLLRKIHRFVDLSGLRAHLGPYYSDVGRPSIDPELMIRMLIVGYCMGIRSERRLCEVLHLNLAIAGSVARAWDRAGREPDRQGLVCGRNLSCSDLAFDPPRNLYVCPGCKELRKYRRAFSKPRDGLTKTTR